MSRLAPFVDAAVSIDRTAWPNLFISYYTYGQAIGLGLDLSLRDRSNGKTSGDDYMKALWARFGRPGQKEPGKVSTAYSIDGLKETLATVSGDRSFANDFFSKFVEGRQVVDYTALLARAGLVMRKRAPGRPFAGQVQLTAGGGSRVARERPGAVGVAALQGRRRAGRSARQPRWHGADRRWRTGRRRWRVTSRAIACRCASCAAAARPSTPRSFRRRSAHRDRADGKDRRHPHRRSKEVQGVVVKLATKVARHRLAMARCLASPPAGLPSALAE